MFKANLQVLKRINQEDNLSTLQTLKQTKNNKQKFRKLQ